MTVHNILIIFTLLQEFSASVTQSCDHVSFVVLYLPEDQVSDKCNA